MARTRKRAIWIHTEASYGVDADSSGAAYLWVPTKSIGDLRDTKAILETNYFTGRNFPTRPLAGQDGWEFDFELPVIGLPTAAGDGATPGADDWFDKILTSIFGSQIVSVGEGVGSGSGNFTLDLDTDVYDAQHVVCVHEANLPTSGERAQWNLTTNATDPYNVAQQWEANPTTAAIAYGTKAYVFDDDGGPTLSVWYLDDDVGYSCLGGRIVSASISASAGQIAVMKCSIRGNTKTENTAGHSSRPAVGNGPAVSAVRGLLSPVTFVDSRYSTTRIELDFGLNAAVVESTAAANGRAGDELISGVPSLSIEPLRTNAILNLKRDLTQGRLQAQFGSGAVSGGIVNSVCAYFDDAYVMEANPTDENGRTRQSVKFMLSDNVVSSTVVRPFQFVRA